MTRPTAPRARIATLAALVTLIAPACSGGAVVARYPWVEHRGIALERETLRLVVRADRVEVDAHFGFRVDAEVDDCAMMFPVGAPAAPATDFVVTLGAEGAASSPAGRAVAVARGPITRLPVGDARESYDLAVGCDALRRHGGRLRVRYSQRAGDAFAYILQSGAYWRGPIRRLDVLVDDPGRRLTELEIEGRPLDVRATSYARAFVDLEPRGGVRMKLRTPAR